MAGGDESPSSAVARGLLERFLKKLPRLLHFYRQQMPSHALHPLPSRLQQQSARLSRAPAQASGRQWPFLDRHPLSGRTAKSPRDNYNKQSLPETSFWASMLLKEFQENVVFFITFNLNHEEKVFQILVDSFSQN